MRSPSDLALACVSAAGAQAESDPPPSDPAEQREDVVPFSDPRAASEGFADPMAKPSATADTEDLNEILAIINPVAKMM